MRNGLNFVCPWEEDKSKTWSGTCYGVHNALEKYFTISEYDTGLQVQSREVLYFKIIRKLKNIFHCYTPDMGMMRMNLIDKKICKDLERSNVPIFLFEECPSLFPEKSYIYMDLYAGYVRQLYEQQPDIFKISGYQKVPEQSIILREEKQRRFLDNIAGVFTMSKWLQRNLIELYGLPSDKVHHVGGGCNLAVKNIRDDQRTGNKILFVGRDFRRKGGYLVLQAFEKAKRIKDDLELYIAGPEKLDVELRDGIRLLGDLPSTELYRYFNLCDIFCLPSYFEAYGLVFVEALIYGLPCIGRSVYEMPYFIEDGITGRLLRSDSSDELAGLMMDLMENEQIKRNVRNKREWYSQEYSWDTVAKRIHKIICVERT